MNETTKISISKELHTIVKKICSQNGLKMQFFEDRAIEKFIMDNYPQYMKDYKPLEVEEDNLGISKKH